MLSTEDRIINELRVNGAYYTHLNLPQEEVPALRKLESYGFISLNQAKNTYRFTEKGHAIAESGKTFYQFTHPSKFDKIRSHFNDNWVGYVIGGIFGVIVTLIAGYIILKIEYGYFQ